MFEHVHRVVRVLSFTTQKGEFTSVATEEPPWKTCLKMGRHKRKSKFVRVKKKKVPL